MHARGSIIAASPPAERPLVARLPRAPAPLHSVPPSKVQPASTILAPVRRSAPALPQRLPLTECGAHAPPRWLGALVRAPEPAAEDARRVVWGAGVEVWGEVGGRGSA